MNLLSKKIEKISYIKGQFIKLAKYLDELKEKQKIIQKTNFSIKK